MKRGDVIRIAIAIGVLLLLVISRLEAATTVAKRPLSSGVRCEAHSVILSVCLFFAVLLCHLIAQAICGSAAFNRAIARAVASSWMASPFRSGLLLWALGGTYGGMVWMVIKLSP